MKQPPDERDLEQAVRGWMRAEEDHAADRSRQVGRIMGRVDETHQRQGAWRFVPFWRGTGRIDRNDDELYVSSGGGIGVRRGMSSALAVAAVVAILAMSVAVLELVPRTITPGAGGEAPADPLDELTELNYRAWGGEPELLSEVYAPDGVHTATFYDRTNEYVGPVEIARVAGWGGSAEAIGPRIDIPAADGEWRWASFTGLGGGTACLFHAVDGQIVRHDCVVPGDSIERRAVVGLADAEASAAIDAVAARMQASWGNDTSTERLAEVYAPDAIHRARFLDGTRSYVGPEEILEVARLGSAPELIGERVAFEAPDGQLAWAGVTDVGGGAVCLFRAVGDMITHHDCVLPIED